MSGVKGHMRAFLVEVIGTGPPSLMSRVLSEEAKCLQRRHVTPPVTECLKVLRLPASLRSSSLFTLSEYSHLYVRGSLFVRSSLFYFLLFTVEGFLPSALGLCDAFSLISNWIF